METANVTVDLPIEVAGRYAELAAAWGCTLEVCIARVLDSVIDQVENQRLVTERALDEMVADDIAFGMYDVSEEEIAAAIRASKLSK